MDLTQFSMGLMKLGLNQAQIALAVLWFHDEEKPDVTMSSGEISRIIYQTGLGSPHSTKLGEQLRKSGMVITSTKGLRATNSTGLNLGRDAKKALTDIKKLADRSAHNRRYTAV